MNCIIQSMYFPLYNLKRKSQYPENNFPSFNFNTLNVSSRVFLQVKEKIKSPVFTEDTHYWQLGGNGTFSHENRVVLTRLPYTGQPARAVVQFAGCSLNHTNRHTCSYKP